MQRLPLAIHSSACLAVDFDADGALDIATTGAGYGGGLFDDIVEVFLADRAQPGARPRAAALP